MFHQQVVVLRRHNTHIRLRDLDVPKNRLLGENYTNPGCVHTVARVPEFQILKDEIVTFNLEQSAKRWASAGKIDTEAIDQRRNRTGAADGDGIAVQLTALPAHRFAVDARIN